MLVKQAFVGTRCSKSLNPGNAPSRKPLQVTSATKTNPLPNGSRAHSLLKGKQVRMMDQNF
eukprot:1159192-Pelagomonas_calceolata.AAC.7